MNLNKNLGKRITEIYLYPTKVCMFYELSKTILLFSLCNLHLDLIQILQSTYLFMFNFVCTFSKVKLRPSSTNKPSSCTTKLRNSNQNHSYDLGFRLLARLKNSCHHMLHSQKRWNLSHAREFQDVHEDRQIVSFKRPNKARF